MNLYAMLALQQGNAERIQHDNNSRPRQNGFMQAFAQASGQSSVGLPMSASPSPQTSRALPPESIERHLQTLGVTNTQLQHADMQALVADIVEQPALQEALETLANSLTLQVEDGLSSVNSDSRLSAPHASLQASANMASVDGEPNALQNIAQRLALIAMFDETTPDITRQPTMSVAQTQPDIAPPLASQGWSRELGQPLAQRVQAANAQVAAAPPSVQSNTEPQIPDQRQPTVRVQWQLNPAERGPLTVSLLTGEQGVQGVQANFVAADPQVREAIEQAAPLLREALKTSSQPLATLHVASPDASISAPLASPGWSRELGQQLAQRVQAVNAQIAAAQSSVQLSAEPHPPEQRQPVQVQWQLNPAEHGPLTVSLVSGEQGVQANFVSADPQVRQAIEQAAPLLSESLKTSSQPLATVHVASPPQPQDASISAPLASPGWSRELGQQLAQHVQAANAQIAAAPPSAQPSAEPHPPEQRQPVQVQWQLNPAEHGPLTVSLVSGKQGVQANFVAADPQVRQAIEQATPLLSESLKTSSQPLATVHVASPPQPQDASISAPLASPGWSRELGQQLAQRVQVTHAQIAADPPSVPSNAEPSHPGQRQPAIQVQDASISAPLASPGWSRELGQQLAQHVQAANAQVAAAQPSVQSNTESQQPGQRQPTVQVQWQLNPAERGPLTVSLVSGEQGVQANFVAADPQVREAIEQAAPLLREALKTSSQPLATMNIEAPSQPTMANDSVPQRTEKIMAMLQSVINDRQAQPSASENHRQSSLGGLTWDSQTLMTSNQLPVLSDSSKMPPTQGSRDLLLAALNAPHVDDHSRRNAFEFATTLTQGLNAQGASPLPGQSPTTMTQGSIQAPLTSTAWPRELGQQLIPLTQRSGEQQIKLNIHPAELGPLSVSLKMGEQGAQAHFLSAHAQVRQVLEMAIPQLREALAEQGINLADTSVSEQRQQEGGDAALAGGGGNQSGEGSAAGDNDTQSDIASPRQTLALDGRVDLYA